MCAATAHELVTSPIRRTDGELLHGETFRTTNMNVLSSVTHPRNMIRDNESSCERFQKRYDRK